MRYLLSFFLIFTCPTIGWCEMGLPATPFGFSLTQNTSPVKHYETLYPKADEYARTAPEFKHLEEIVDYLVKPYGDDETLKARVLFAWLVYHMNYDSFKAKNLSGNISDGKRRYLNSGNAFKTRIGVCGDFADLFVKMAGRARLKAKRINGVAGYHLTRLTAPENPHAWNAVRVGKEWKLLDVTWAMMGDSTVFDEMKKMHDYKKSVRERRKHTQDLTVSEQRSINNKWFFTPPTVMIETHFPNDIRWELLDKPISPHDIFKANENPEKNKKMQANPIRLGISAQK